MRDVLPGCFGKQQKPITIGNVAQTMLNPHVTCHSIGCGEATLGDGDQCPARAAYLVRVVKARLAELSVILPEAPVRPVVVLHLRVGGEPVWASGYAELQMGGMMRWGGVGRARGVTSQSSDSLT